jgi:hypothetical protein
LINNIIRAENKRDLEMGRPVSFDFSVRYAGKGAIRQAVLSSEACATADMTSWFDELRMPGPRDLMGVVYEAGNIFELLVAGMGYIPSCKIAQAALGALAFTLFARLDPRIGRKHSAGSAEMSAGLASVTASLPPRPPECLSLPLQLRL